MYVLLFWRLETRDEAGNAYCDERDAEATTAYENAKLCVMAFEVYREIVRKFQAKGTRCC
jgi:hypothetical protein